MLAGNLARAHRTSIVPVASGQLHPLTSVRLLRVADPERRERHGRVRDLRFVSGGLFCVVTRRRSAYWHSTINHDVEYRVRSARDRSPLLEEEGFMLSASCRQLRWSQRLNNGPTHPRWRSVAAVLCGVTMIVVACKSQSGSPPAESGFVGERVPHASRVVVFVHGVLGSKDTWTAKNGAYWPEMLKSDPTFRSVDVFDYEYDSPLLASGLSIDELADDLRRVAMHHEIFTKHKDVVFLCHSMGGLVVRAFLLKYREFAPQVSMIYFFATPTTGSSLAQVAAVTRAKNRQFKDMNKWTDNAYVGNLVLGWQAAQFPIMSYCAYEGRDTDHFRVVEQQSATNLCNMPIDPIDRDHIDIVKPENASQPPYIAFKNAYIDATARAHRAAVQRLVNADSPEAFMTVFDSVFASIDQNNAPAVFDLNRRLTSDYNPLAEKAWNPSRKREELNRLSQRDQTKLDVLKKEVAFVAGKVGATLKSLSTAEEYDLHSMSLWNSDLRDANLRSANLTAANLSEADLRNTDLTGASMTDANLFRVDLDGANLGDITKYRGATFDETAWWHANHVSRPLLQYLIENYPYKPHTAYAGRRLSSQSDYEAAKARLQQSTPD
jgi:pimeloyl-ACP methyl ester carboxylesterase